MTELSNALFALAGELTLVMGYEKTKDLVCFEEMTSSGALIETAGRLAAGVRREIELSIGNTLVGVDCSGLGMSTWVPELNAVALTFEAVRLERALLVVHTTLVQHQASLGEDRLKGIFC